MIQSMTGYGRATCEFKNKKFTIEIKSLNSKQADISTPIPNYFKENLSIHKLLIKIAAKRQKAMTRAEPYLGNCSTSTGYTDI